MIVGISQSSPVWMDKKSSIQKVLSEMDKAVQEKVELLVFSEGYVPGYPFWVSYTGGAEFDNQLQKEMFGIYHQNAVDVEGGDLKEIQQACKQNKMALYLGVIEKTKKRGSTLYCSLVYIHLNGKIKSVHRKLVPTFDERLVWGNGDGNGLKTHALKEFTVGGLNCWENWMPLSRTALYAQGENLHVAVWPGSDHNTNEITRFVARESRSYVISASSTLDMSQVDQNLPIYSLLQQNAPKVLANGGSCIAQPSGEWLIEPVINQEKLIVAELDIHKVAQERQNFDPTGHYSRPDVLHLKMNKKRQTILK